MTTTTKSGTGISRYLQVYRVLSQALAEGRFGVGEPLPSEPRLMRECGVSRSTVRRALAQLEAEGRIERRRGSGTFARPPRGQEAAARKDLSLELEGTGSRPQLGTVRTIDFQRIPTPAFLLAEQPEFGPAGVLIRQIRCLGREPIALDTAYVPDEIGGRLTRRRLDAEHGAVLTVLAALGHPSAGLEREFAALEADPLAANSLGLAIGAPVFSVRTLARDPQHQIVAYVSSSYRPDRYEAHATIEIGQSARDRSRKRS